MDGERVGRNRIAVSVDSGGAVAPTHEEPCDEDDAPVNKKFNFAAEVAKMVDKTYRFRSDDSEILPEDEVYHPDPPEALPDHDSFFTDLVVSYSMTLWNLTNYSTMVRTKSTAANNSRLLYKIGLDTTADLHLLHAQVGSLYEVLQTSPWERDSTATACKYGDFRNYARCIMRADCLLQKGVLMHAISTEAYTLLKELTRRYLRGSHRVLVHYIDNVTHGQGQQDDDKDFECKWEAATKTISPHQSLIEEEVSESGRERSVVRSNADSELSGGRRRRRRGGRRRRFFRKIVGDVKHAAADVVKGVEDVAHVIKDAFACIGAHSNVQQVGYKWDRFDPEAGDLGVSFEVALKSDIPEDIKNVWKSIVSKKSVDHISFDIEASLAVVIGAGTEFSILGHSIDADFGIGAEIALGYDHKAGEPSDLELELSVGEFASAGKSSDKCPFGSHLGPAECFAEDEFTISIMCCHVDFFTGDHNCR